MSPYALAVPDLGQAPASETIADSTGNTIVVSALPAVRILDTDLDTVSLNADTETVNIQVGDSATVRLDDTLAASSSANTRNRSFDPESDPASISFTFSTAIRNPASSFPDHKSGWKPPPRPPPPGSHDRAWAVYFRAKKRHERRLRFRRAVLAGFMTLVLVGFWAAYLIVALMLFM